MCLTDGRGRGIGKESNVVGFVEVSRAKRFPHELPRFLASLATVKHTAGGSRGGRRGGWRGRRGGGGGGGAINLFS